MMICLCKNSEQHFIYYPLPPISDCSFISQVPWRFHSILFLLDCGVSEGSLCFPPSLSLSPSVFRWLTSDRTEVIKLQGLITVTVFILFIFFFKVNCLSKLSQYSWQKTGKRLKQPFVQSFYAKLVFEFVFVFYKFSTTKKCALYNQKFKCFESQLPASVDGEAEGKLNRKWKQLTKQRTFIHLYSLNNKLW